MIAARTRSVNVCYAEEMHGKYKDKYKIHTEIT